jgi:hypothetical protein
VNVTVLSSDDAKSFVTFVVDTDRSGYTFVLLDRRTRTTNILARWPIAAYADRISPMKPIAFQSRDGLLIHGYLTVPLGTGGSIRSSRVCPKRRAPQLTFETRNLRPGSPWSGSGVVASRGFWRAPLCVTGPWVYGPFALVSGVAIDAVRKLRVRKSC